VKYKIDVDNFDRNEWEQRAQEFADYSIYQTWPYQQVRGETDGQKISRFIIKDENGHVASMGQVRIKYVKILGLKIGYIQSGPLVRAFDGTLRCGVESLKALRMAYVGDIVNVLRIAPNVCDDEDGKKVAESLEFSGFEKVSSITPYHTIMVSLKEPEEKIRARIHRESRRILRKVEKMELQVKQGAGEEFFNILESLYVGAKRRKAFKGLDPKEFAWTQQMLASNDTATVLIAYYDDQPVTAHATTHFGNTAVPILTASNELGLRFGTSYLLWWKAYLMAKDLGLEYYDLGGIDPEKNPKGYLFKKRMGGEEAFHIGTFEAYTNPIILSLWHLAEKCYRFFMK